MVLTLFLLADYALQQFSSVFSCSTQKLVCAWSFPLWMRELHSSWQAARRTSLTGSWDGLHVWKAAGVGMREVLRRCLATAMRRRNCTHVPAERWAPTEERRRVLSTAGSHRDELQLRGAGFGIMAVQTDSFQVRLEPRSQRVHGIICSSKDVKRVMKDSRQQVAGVLLWLRTVYKTFPCVSTCFLHQ